MLNYTEFHRMLKNACEKRNIEMDVLSFGYITKLTKGNIVKYIYGRHFDNNTGVFAKIARDKYALYEVLKSNDLPIIEHKMLFNPKTREDYMTREKLESIVKEYLVAHPEGIVIKPNDGYSGIGVSKVNTFDEAIKKIDEIFIEKDNLVMCPLYNFKNEYRVIFLDGKMELVFSKERPFVIGNGKNTIKELYLENIDSFSPKLTIEKMEQIPLEYVPEVGEKVLLSWKHNLYNGAVPRIVEDEETLEKLQELLLDINSKFKIFFASVDIVELEDGSFRVIEINSSVHMDIFSETLENGKDLVENIFGAVLDKYFNL